MKLNVRDFVAKNFSLFGALGALVVFCAFGVCLVFVWRLSVFNGILPIASFPRFPLNGSNNAVAVSALWCPSGCRKSILESACNRVKGRQVFHLEV